MNSIISYCFLLLLFYSVSICSGQNKNMQSVEEMLFGTWVEVPGQKLINSPFQTNYLAPDTIVFYKNKTLKSLEQGKYVKGNWKIDISSNHLMIDFEDEYKPYDKYEFRFLELTNENCFLEAADDEDADEEELFKIRMKKLPEK